MHLDVLVSNHALNGMDRPQTLTRQHMHLVDNLEWRKPGDQKSGHASHRHHRPRFASRHVSVHGEGSGSPFNDA